MPELRNADSSLHINKDISHDETSMIHSRRKFLVSGTAALAAYAMLPRRAHAATGAIDFDSGDNLEITSGAPSATPFTASLWFWTDAIGANQSVFYLHNTAFTQWQGVFIGTNGILRIDISTTGSVGATVLAANTWYHIAYTRNGAAHTLYLNGVSEATVSDNLTVTSNAIDLGNDFTGRKAAVKMWAAALSQDEVVLEGQQYWPVRSANLYGFWPLRDSGDVNDLSGNGHHFTAIGSLTTADGPSIPTQRCRPGGMMMMGVGC